VLLAEQALQWGELASLRVGDVVMAPGPGLRVVRAVLRSNGGGELYVNSVKSNRSRTVPIVSGVEPIIGGWTAGKTPDEWLFSAPKGGPLYERNWQRSVRWRNAVSLIGPPDLASTISGTRPHPSGSLPAPIRRWSTGY
jgi:hypothetical protein